MKCFPHLHQTLLEFHQTGCRSLPFMAALSFQSSIFTNYYSKSHILGKRPTSRLPPSDKISTCFSCQSRDERIISSFSSSDQRDNKEKKEMMKEKEGTQSMIFSKLVVEAAKMGKELKSNLSPRQKGDWKDVMLMSLSFAIYVYISQKIVCAYCAWMSMLKQPW